MKEYIGDGISAERRDGYLILTTENGMATTNQIYIEPEAWLALCVYMGVK